MRFKIENFFYSNKVKVRFRYLSLKPVFLWVVLFFFYSWGGFAPLPAFADESPWTFLPLEPQFAPLIGDYQEPNVSVIPHLSEQAFEGNVGGTAELIRWKSAEDMQWGVGVFGGAFFLFQDAGLSTLRVVDWTSGFYLSEKTGLFSFRAEFQDEKSDLGDEYEYVSTNALPSYDWHNNNLTVAFNPTDQFRLFAGGGAKVFWEVYDPTESLAFVFGGAEAYSNPFPFLSPFCRAYGTYYLKYQDQDGGIVDQEFQLGLQFKGDADQRRALRLAVLYYLGHADYGLFSDQPNTHYFGFGLFIDP